MLNSDATICNAMAAIILPRTGRKNCISEAWFWLDFAFLQPCAFLACTLPFRWKPLPFDGWRTSASRLRRVGATPCAATESPVAAAVRLCIPALFPSIVSRFFTLFGNRFHNRFSGSMLRKLGTANHARSFKPGERDIDFAQHHRTPIGCNQGLRSCRGRRCRWG